MFEEYDETMSELEELHLSYQKRLARMCTFPIDYVQDGMYGVFAKERESGKTLLLQTDENIWNLFQYVTDIAGEEAHCELSEMAIAIHDLDEMLELEDISEDSFDIDCE